ncbi:MAG TPA: FlgD immunoglobulin-like domain containing protein, partial [Bacteroidales bacterium]|nr:FlgD immunoglobulin-like domain containing protein [Bacteroidales bacterium]
KWVYHKDFAISSGADCAWIDFISFPAFEGALPVIQASPQAYEKFLYQGQEAGDSLAITNAGGDFLNYSAVVFDTTAKKKKLAPADLTGSYIECQSDGFIPGQDYSWTFILHHLGPDIENINHVKMDFTPGVWVNSATNFTGGSLGDLVFQGSTGNGASLNWHGETPSGEGVVKTGETATAVVSGNVQGSFTSDLFLVYSIRGDSNGAPVHSTSGFDHLVNYGLPNTWLTLQNATGTLATGQTRKVGLHFSTTGLPVNSYSCDLIARDDNNNRIILPVVLHVLDSTTIGWREHPDDRSMFRACPNPFMSTTRFDYYLDRPSEVVLEIYSTAGIRVRTYQIKNQEEGLHGILWDGKDENGSELPAGIYYGHLQTDHFTTICRLVRIR